MRDDYRSLSLSLSLSLGRRTFARARCAFRSAADPPRDRRIWFDPLHEIDREREREREREDGVAHGRSENQRNASAPVHFN